MRVYFKKKFHRFWKQKSMNLSTLFDKVIRLDSDLSSLAFCSLRSKKRKRYAIFDFHKEGPEKFQV